MKLYCHNCGEYKGEGELDNKSYLFCKGKPECLRAAAEMYRRSVAYLPVAALVCALVLLSSLVVRWWLGL